MKTSPAAVFEVPPDPVVCASIYCSGRLDEVVARLVAPFWRGYRERPSARGSYLWLMRYARGGEHLKIRLHAPAAETPVLRELLLDAQAEFFSRPAPLPGSPRTSTPAAPPVDAEDGAAADYPDRTFLWTRYGRSPLSLGYRPYLDDDRYCALLTRCLGAGGEIVVDRLESGPEGECPYSIQREIWREAVLAGLLATPLSARDRSLYLLYHRDCLLRFLRRRKRWTDGTAALAQVIANFDRQKGRTELREELAGAMAEHQDPGRPPRSGGLELGPWRDALRALSEHVSPLLGDPDYHVDPFADRAIFPVLFKAFHGLANQIGLGGTNEAYLYHALLDAAGEPDLRSRPARLRPEI